MKMERDIAKGLTIDFDGQPDEGFKFVISTCSVPVLPSFSAERHPIAEQFELGVIDASLVGASSVPLEYNGGGFSSSVESKTKLQGYRLLNRYRTNLFFCSLLQLAT